MHRLAPLPLLLLSLCAQAQPQGLPGTATPQPYAQPQVRSLPAAPYGTPPLLVNPGQPARPLVNPPPAPRGQPLPQLEKRQQGQQRPAVEPSDKP